nr:HAD domain-containing protein [uncultured Albidiferax sp.]
MYLDLDGVVHHEAVLWHYRRGIHMSPTEALGRSLFEWVPFLEDALNPFPEVKLVLSSSWCINPGYGKTVKRFPQALQQRFVGGTYHKRVHAADPWAIASFRSMPRGQQVWADVQRRKPRAWIALDDDTEDWPASVIENLVACDGDTGLSSKSVRDELTEKLERAHRTLPDEASSCPS